MLVLTWMCLQLWLLTWVISTVFVSRWAGLRFVRKTPLQLDQHLQLQLFKFVNGTLIGSWLPTAFLFSVLVFLAVGLWTLHDQKNVLPVIVVSVHKQMGEDDIRGTRPPFLPSLKMLCRYICKYYTPISLTSESSLPSEPYLSTVTL